MAPPLAILKKHLYIPFTPLIIEEFKNSFPPEEVKMIPQISSAVLSCYNDQVKLAEGKVIQEQWAIMGWLRNRIHVSEEELNKAREEFPNDTSIKQWAGVVDAEDRLALLQSQSTSEPDDDLGPIDKTATAVERMKGWSLTIEKRREECHKHVMNAYGSLKFETDKLRTIRKSLSRIRASFIHQNMAVDEEDRVGEDRKRKVSSRQRMRKEVGLPVWVPTNELSICAKKGTEVVHL